MCIVLTSLKQYVETHGFETLPILVRPEAAIPFNPTLKTPEGDYHSGLKVLVNGPLSAEKKVEVVTHEDVGSIAKTLTTGDAGDMVVDLSESGVLIEKRT